MWSSVDQHEDNDNSMIEIIEKAEELLLQVENLKARIDNVIKENPGKFCSVTQLSIIGPSDGFNHSVHNSELLFTDDTLSTCVGIARFIETTNRTHLEVPGENVSFII